METVDDNPEILELSCDGTFDISSLPPPSTSLDTLQSSPTPKPSWAIAKDLGNESFQNSDYDDAMKKYTKALELGKETAGDVEMGKVYSNRAISALKQSISSTSSQLPSTFNIRTISELTRGEGVDLELLGQALDDCDKATSHFSVVPIHSTDPTSSDSKNTSNVLKALHRKTLTYCILSKPSSAISTSQKTLKILTHKSSSSIPLTLKTSIEDLHGSLMQLEKDEEATRRSLESVSSMIMKEKDINTTKASLSSSLNCVSSGGSVIAALHVSTVTAYNLITTGVEVDSSETLHKVIMELTEVVAKVCHYHKCDVGTAAEVMYDICMRRSYVDSIKYVGTLDSSTENLNVWEMIKNEKYRCCGICCAMLASLRSERMERVVECAEEGVRKVGGGREVAKEVGKMFGGGEMGKKDGHVFKLGPKGQGYYKDNGPMWLGSGSGSVYGAEKEKEEKSLLDPDHPAFKGMTKEQVKAMEQVLKMSDEEVASLPGEQNTMIMEFRKMYKENPSVFQKRKEQPKAPEGEEGKKKKKETDPLQSFKDSRVAMDWFKSEHGDFDKEKFESEEKQRLEKITIEKKEASAERLQRVNAEMSEMGLSDEKKVDNASKDKKKKNKKKTEKKKELDELMGWAKGN
ncbi:hypothetical protein TL16_g11807 [Triparma laevis f. inornata]|uniref:Uncharacterized protein n=1 Tax=Triparma laevis f. inornata TaxID=1714386 RepID=A0A9W7EUJ2_9STRA|nr:hypothetical protein TL16_g11807 [Triparma laevis f. inornata]